MTVDELRAEADRHARLATGYRWSGDARTARAHADYSARLGMAADALAEVVLCTSAMVKRETANRIQRIADTFKGQ